MSVNSERRPFSRIALSFVLGTALAVGAVGSFNTIDAFAVTSAQKKAEVQDAKDKLDALEEEMSMAVEEYNAANRAHEQAEDKVKACKEKIDKAEKKISSLQAHLSTRATTMYRNGAMSYLDVLMGVGSFDDFATVWDTLNALNADDASLVADTKDAKDELESAKKELDEQEAEAKEQLEAAESYKSGIEEKTAEYNALVDSLSAEYRQLVEEEQEAERQAAARAAAAYVPSVSTPSDDGDGDSGGDGGGSSSSSSSQKAYSQEGGSDAVSRAESCLGLPYVYGSAGPGSYDCSGLVSYALTGSHSHRYVSGDFWAMPAVSDPQPGDVVACHAGHCGLYIGDGMMIEAPHTGAVVRVSPVRGKIVRP